MKILICDPKKGFLECCIITIVNMVSKLGPCKQLLTS